jgi:hypothetical protein
VLAAAIALLLASGAAIVFVLDPFQVLRPARGTANLYGVPEFQIPGLARFYPYDAVVTGTSTSNNFSPADLDAALGLRTMNFALAGSSIEEQRAVLDVALATGKVRTVFWGLDAFAFAPHPARGFPYYLYREPGWRTAPYFVNLGALDHAFATLVTPDAARMTLARWNASRSWAGDYVYNRAQVAAAWQHRHTLMPAPLPDTAEEAATLVDRRLVDVIRAHPSVRFDLVLVPYTALYYRMLADERPRELDEVCRLDAAIVARAGALPNAAVFNFRDADGMMLDLDRFHDLLHFSGGVSREIVGDVAAGRRRVTPASFAGVCDRLRAAAARARVE